MLTVAPSCGKSESATRCIYIWIFAMENLYKDCLCCRDAPIIKIRADSDTEIFSLLLLVQHSHMLSRSLMFDHNNRIQTGHIFCPMIHSFTKLAVRSAKCTELHCYNISDKHLLIALVHAHITCFVKRVYWGFFHLAKADRAMLINILFTVLAVPGHVNNGSAQSEPAPTPSVAWQLHRVWFVGGWFTPSAFSPLEDMCYLPLLGLQLLKSSCLMSAFALCN